MLASNIESGIVVKTKKSRCAMTKQGLLISFINEVCKAIENEVDGLIAEHEGNYGEAKIYKDLSKIINSNTIQLQSCFR